MRATTRERAKAGYVVVIVALLATTLMGTTASKIGRAHV